MEASGPPQVPGPSMPEATSTRSSRTGPGRTLPLRVADVQLYRVCEDLTEGLIYLMLIFSPWAFGTTERWSIWVMNIGGYVLGVFLAAKLSVRWLRGYRPPRWDEGGGPQDHRTTGPRDYALQRKLTVVLAVLTAAILAYCLIGAVNARATYDQRGQSFNYRLDYLKWLPASFDGHRTWEVFWSYLGLACSFWALRDWLLGKTSGEERAGRRKSAEFGVGSAECAEETVAHSTLRTAHSTPAPLLPARLRRLLWALALNGGLLALESLAQRLSGSHKLLFVVQPRVNPEGETQFGPYAYRSNAAQYFNLLWPVCLGFWWTMQRSGGLRRGVLHLLLASSVVMAACPMVSTSRGGALVTVGIGAAALVLLLGAQVFVAQRRESRRSARLALGLLVLCLGVALGLGYALGGKALRPRLVHLQEGFADREQMYEAARPMAADYPLFGTGPGTFEWVFQLYRISTATYWPAQLHNDWLETRITFGWAGSGLIGLALMVVLLRWFARGGIHGGRRFMILAWLALAGALVHARYDFPLQIHSIVFLFLVLCSVLFTLTRRA